MCKKEMRSDVLKRHKCADPNPAEESKNEQVPAEEDKDGEVLSDDEFDFEEE